MHHKDQLKRITAGVFLFFCISMVVFAIFTIGLEKGFTEPKIYMTVLFKDVGGLMLGAPVRLSGVTVGELSIIGANSVVTRSIPEKCIAVGNPAKVIQQWDGTQWRHIRE